MIEKIKSKNKNAIENFYLVYEDKLLKLLETPLHEYMQSEVPYHKIVQIKHYNSIIWDRKKRYYKLDY
jgi:uncharacterized protein (UPF0248 family)